MTGGTDLTILLAFAAGLISFLSPCVLPLVPAYLGQLTAIAIAGDGAAAPNRWLAVRHAFAFVAGFGAVFTLLGVTATYMAAGIAAEGVAAEFVQHANEEQGHADQIAQRIVQLKGEPNFNPEGLLSRSHAEYVEGNSLIDMIKEDLVAERIAIDSYRDMIKYFGDDDPTSRRMLEGILAVEEEHAEDLVSLLDKMG